MSESLESIQQAPLPGILASIGQQTSVKDLFADAGPRKAWHAESADLAEIKADDDCIPLFANRIASVIGAVLGANLRSGGYALVTTPRRRHKQRNFACLVTAAIAQSLQLPYYEDVAFARSKQRVAVDFDLGYLPPENNLIVIDDFVTTGSTLGAMNRLLAPLGKNLTFFVGVDNQ